MTIILADHKDLLIPYPKEKGKYWCPACNGHNLSFSKDGKWNCWNSPEKCHRQEIIKLLFPNESTDWTSQIRRNNPKKQFSSQLFSRLPKISYDLKFAKINTPPIVEKYGRTTYYYYSKSQRVVRIERDNNRKTFYPQYLVDEQWICGAGNNNWKPYGLSNLSSFKQKTNLILLVEGQKSVEIGFERKIPAVCLEGGDYSELTLNNKIVEIKEKFPHLLIAILPDFDPTGIRKAEKVYYACQKAKIPALTINPQSIGCINSGDDIEESSLTRKTLMNIVLNQCHRGNK